MMKVMGVSPLDDKFAAFGWKVLKVDGHDMDAIKKVIDEAKLTKRKANNYNCRNNKR